MIMIMNAGIIVIRTLIESRLFFPPDGKVLYDVKNNGYIKSWTDMKDIVKNPKNGWKVLDIDAEYNTNTDSMWKNVS